LAIIDRDTHDVVCVDRWNKISYPLQTQRVADLARKYGAEVMIDAMNVGAAMGDDLRARGVNVTDFKAVGSISKDKDIKGNKEQAINKLASFLEERNIAIPPEPVWIGELESYGYILGDSGRPKYGAPEGYHDDCVTALYLATWMLYGKKKQENIKAYKAINSVPKTKRFQYL
jgi:hypothetical protein